MQRIILNEELYDQLKPFEEALRTAYYGEVALCLPNGDIKFLFDLYNSQSPSKVYNIGCGSCRLEVLRSIGKSFFAWKEEHPDKKTRKKKGGE